MFGARLGIDDMDAILYLFNLVNKLGLDVISAGGVLGFAIECFEKGLLTAEDTATLTIEVFADYPLVNDPPVAGDDTASTDEDTPVTITVLGNDSDPDGDDLTVTSASAANGEVTINPDGTLASYISDQILVPDSFEGPVPPSAIVPVPAAAWLFISGLLGLVGISRRRRQA